MPSLRRVCLVGVRGVGKTTLIRSLLPQLPHVDYIVGSAVLRELAGADFARFDHLPPEAKQEYRERAIDWMEARQAQEGKLLLCDGHTSLLDESTGQVGAVFTDRDCAFFRELVLLEAPSEVILTRRQGDPTKRRSLDPRVIEAEQRGEWETSHHISARWAMDLHRLPLATDPQVARALLEVLAP